MGDFDSGNSPGPAQLVEETHGRQAAIGRLVLETGAWRVSMFQLDVDDEGTRARHGKSDEALAVSVRGLRRQTQIVAAS